MNSPPSWPFSCSFLLATALLGSTGPATAQDEDPLKTFDQLFGRKIEQVTATSARDDDVKLAGQLLEIARTSADKPELLAVLCNNAYDLGTRDISGYPVAVDAMDLLATKAPKQAGESRDRAVAVLQRWFKLARGEDRTRVGNRLLQATVSLATARERAGAWAAAIVLYRRALAAATALRSPKREQVRAAMERAIWRRQTEGRIDKIKQQLRANPKDAEAGQMLLKLYAVELDDPREAAKYSFLSQDAELKKNLKLATLPIGRLAQADCLALGNWYRGLVERAPGPARRALLTRAHGYLGRYVSLHGTSDLFGKKAAQDLKDVTTELDKLGGPLARRTNEPGAVLQRGLVKTFKFDDAEELARYWSGKSKLQPKADGAHAGREPNATLVSRFKLKGDFEIELDLSFGQAAFTNTGGCWIIMCGQRFSITNGWHGLKARIKIQREGNEVKFAYNDKKERRTIDAEHRDKPTEFYIYWRSRNSHFRKFSVKADAAILPD